MNCTEKLLEPTIFFNLYTNLRTIHAFACPYRLYKNWTFWSVIPKFSSDIITFCNNGNQNLFSDTVKPVLSSHSKVDQKLVFKTDNRLMQVKSIAECSPLWVEEKRQNLRLDKLHIWSLFLNS